MEQSKFYQIKNITEQEYTLVGCDGSVITRPIQDVDKSASVFTIQDAKVGDVLFYKGDVNHSNGIKYERICLFNNLNKAFFTLTKTSNYVEDYHIDVNIDYHDNTVPATKEQKEILFMTIRTAGYEWDDEKKELKKIEQNPAWSEEDEKIIDSSVDNLTELMHRYGEKYGNVGKCIDWLKSLKPRTLWHPADGDYLPKIDREVIALLDNGKVVFAHRPQESWKGKNISTGKTETFYPKRYDKGGWNQPNVKWWLDLSLPK